MKKILEINKCPNCGGRMEARGSIAHCLFCDSEFSLGDVSTESEVEEAPVKKKSAGGEGFNKPEWFDYRVEFKKLCKGHDTKEAMKEFSRCCDELGTSASIIKYIQRELAGESGIYYEKHKPDKMNAFINKAMRGQLVSGETALFYVNTAIFSCGKHGFLITDQKIVFSGRTPIAIPYSDLFKLAFDNDSDFVNIHVNGISDANINCIEGSSNKPYGAIAALISAFAFEQDPGREKIIICKYDDGDDDDDDE